MLNCRTGHHAPAGLVNWSLFGEGVGRKRSEQKQKQGVSRARALERSLISARYDGSTGHGPWPVGAYGCWPVADGP